MTEILDDTERGELKDGEKKGKKEMTVEEMLTCPTWDCGGGPEVWPTGVRTAQGDIWAVGCPRCRGWVSQMLIKEGDSPYERGVDVWMEMRKEMGH